MLVAVEINVHLEVTYMLKFQTYLLFLNSHKRLPAHMPTRFIFVTNVPSDIWGISSMSAKNHL